MGKIFEIGDSKGLADAVLEIVSNQQAYTRMNPDDFSCYEPSSVAYKYEVLFNQIDRELHPQE
jgi:hypothetical protein